MASSTSSKAMKVLGLSRLPPDASPAEHQALLRQHRSVRLERAKSNSPPALPRMNSSSSQGSESPTFTSKYARAGREERGGSSFPTTPDKDCEGEQDSDESDPLRLTAADLDDDYINMLSSFMSQFPEPPTRSPAVDSSSSVSSTAGRLKWVDMQGGQYNAKSLGNWMPGRGGGEEDQPPPPPPPPPPIERHRTPVYHFDEHDLHQQMESAGDARGGVSAHETDAPMVRVKYSTGENFDL